MTDFVWLNQALLHAHDARIDPGDRGFLLSDGLFETLRVTNGKTPHFDRHMNRLMQGCHILRLSPPSVATLHAATHQVVSTNKTCEGSVRITLTRGSGPRGLLPPKTPQCTLLITSTLHAHTMAPPVNVRISQYTRPSDTPLARVKSLAYLPAIMARLDAQDDGYDDALMLGDTKATAKTIACGTTGTLLLYGNNMFVTPHLRDGALPGTSRARLLEQQLCIEASITTECLHHYQNAWFINALSITPIVRIDHFTFERNTILDRRLHDALFSNELSQGQR